MEKVDEFLVYFVFVLSRRDFDCTPKNCIQNSAYRIGYLLNLHVSNSIRALQSINTLRTKMIHSHSMSLTITIKLKNENKFHKECFFLNFGRDVERFLCSR